MIGKKETDSSPKGSMREPLVGGKKSVPEDKITKIKSKSYSL